MNFSMITNMNSYLKTGSLKQTWMQKAQNPAASGAKHTGAAAQGTENNDQKTGVLGMLESLQRQTENQDHRLSGIIGKMQSGQDLSASDLEYLRKASPETYEKAVKLIREKAEYERELQNCKTKDEARALQLSRVSEALSKVKMGQETGDVATCVEASAKLNTMTAVYTEFTQSAAFEDMADNALELAEAVEAEREQAQGTQESDEVPAEEDAENEAPVAAADAESASSAGETAEKADALDEAGTAKPATKRPNHSQQPKGHSASKAVDSSATRAKAPELDFEQRKIVRHAKGYKAPPAAGYPADAPDASFSVKA